MNREAGTDDERIILNELGKVRKELSRLKEREHELARVLAALRRKL